jgi:hypothetical protein
LRESFLQKNPVFMQLFHHIFTFQMLKSLS